MVEMTSFCILRTCRRLYFEYGVDAVGRFTRRIRVFSDQGVIHHEQQLVIVRVSAENAVVILKLTCLLHFNYYRPSYLFITKNDIDNEEPIGEATIKFLSFWSQRAQLDMIESDLLQHQQQSGYGQSNRGVLQSMMRGRPQKLQKLKKVQVQIEGNPESPAQQALALLDQLFQSRLIEKLARPVSLQIKQGIYDQYKLKLDSLHLIMDKLSHDLYRENETIQSKQRSQSSTKIERRSSLQRNDVRKIEEKYTEILIKGSFKFYQKVAKLYGLPLDLRTLQIEQWANQCQSDDPKDSCC